MLKNINNEVEQFLNNFSDEEIFVEQKGFIESTYTIHKFSYSIKYDILNMMDQNSTNYIKINLNQVYRLENEEDKILKFYLDNDMEITLRLKR